MVFASSRLQVSQGFFERNPDFFFHSAISVYEAIIFVHESGAQFIVRNVVEHRLGYVGRVFLGEASRLPSLFSGDVLVAERTPCVGGPTYHQRRRCKLNVSPTKIYFSLLKLSIWLTILRFVSCALSSTVLKVKWGF